MRGVIARAGRRRCPAPPQASRTAPADPETPPQPRQKRAPRRPRAAAPAVPPQGAARPGWIARWFGRSRPAPAARNLPPDTDDGLFTPEAYPNLAPEVCDFLNTPIEECDPDLLCLVLGVVAQHIAEQLPPELGLDAKALFSTLTERLGALAAQARSDAAAVEPPVTPDAVPPTAPQAEPADDPAVSTANDPAPEAAAPAAPATVRRDPSLAFGAPFRRRPPAHRCRSAVRRARRAEPCPPPPRRLSYAACAGPP